MKGDNYLKLLQECVRVLKPGGYLSLLEIEYHVDYITGEESPEINCPEMWG
jgi:ubiquinone/menaquinone biosynthesis C-methylase UbiE